MCLLTHCRRTMIAPCLAFAFVLACAAIATGCPTCKESIAHDPNSANLSRGYFYSIMFMLSAPYLIFGSLAGYFYWQIRKARASQAWENAAEQPTTLPLT